MGLLSRISAELPQQEAPADSKRTGLLAKTVKIAEMPVFSSFYDLCDAYSFTNCALFTIVNGFFVITACKGIDAASVASSVSSRDFWNGTIGSPGSFIDYAEIDSKFSGFFQLFSSSVKENTAGFHFLKVSGDCIFVNIDLGSYKDISVPATELKEAILSFLSSRTDNSPPPLPELTFVFSHSIVYMLLLSVKLAVNSSVRTADVGDKYLSNSIFLTVYTEIFSVLKKHFVCPNYCTRSGNGEIKIILCGQKTFDDSLLQYHIAKSLNSILSQYSDSVILLKAGTASSEDDVRRFMLEG